MLRGYSRYFASLVETSDEKESYGSYQALLQTFITVSTLLMGFIITGALISLSFSGEDSYGSEDVLEFLRNAFRAFMMAFLGFSLSLMLSIVGSAINTTPRCGFHSASRFFRTFSLLFVVAELSLYVCTIATLAFIKSYVVLNYQSPAFALCPAGDNIIMQANKFCAQFGADMYEAASDICGAPRQEQRTYIPGNLTSVVCSTFDAYGYDEGILDEDPGVRKIWFGYTIPANFDLGGGVKFFDRYGATEERQMIEALGKVLGEAMCGKTDVLSQTVKDKCKVAPISIDCATMLQAFNGADICAGEKIKDASTCFKTCVWSPKWHWAVFPDFLDDVMDSPKQYIQVAKAYDPIYAAIGFMNVCIWIWVVVRIGIYFSLLVWSSIIACREADNEQVQNEQSHSEEESDAYNPLA